MTWKLKLTTFINHLGREKRIYQPWQQSLLVKVLGTNAVLNRPAAWLGKALIFSLKEGLKMNISSLAEDFLHCGR